MTSPSEPVPAAAAEPPAAAGPVRAARRAAGRAARTIAAAAAAAHATPAAAEAPAADPAPAAAPPAEAPPTAEAAPAAEAPPAAQAEAAPASDAATSGEAVSRTTDIVAGPGGVMTDEVGVVTGDLTLRTDVAGGQVTVNVQYKDAGEWYVVTGARAPLKDPADIDAVHGIVTAILNRPEG